jgi:IclR family transcriptional regulator, acetate operon repressor
MDGAMSSGHRTADDDPPADRPTAVAKVVRVVEALTEHSGVSEISRTTGLPTSTVHRIIQELVSLGWVRGDGDHGYRPGAGLLTLSAQAASHAAMSIVVPILEHLRDATTHTIHFALRQGDQAVYVAKVEGQRAYEMRSRVGLAIPVHCTGIGKALLAALTEEEVRAILQRAGMPSRTPRTITDPDAMLEHLRTVARRGYAIDNEENELHTRCVAAVVRDHRGIATGGISMSAMAFEFDQERVQQVAPLVVAAARDVSQALGYRPTTAELAGVQRNRP